MKGYVLRRLLLIVPTGLFLVSVLFFMMQVIPGDVASTLLAGPESAGSPQQIAALRKQLGLTEPIYVQYGKYVAQVLRGNLGYSALFNESVWGTIAPRLQVTVTLAVLGLIFAVLLSIPAGILSALYRGSFLDQVIRGISAAGMAIPAFWLAIIILLILSQVFHWAPPHYTGLPHSPRLAFEEFGFPALVLGFRAAATISRVTRSMMLEVLQQDYVRTARAKGLLPRVVIVKHALRNALLPVVTMLGMLFGTMVAGAVVLEEVFNLPGVGLQLVAAVSGRDVPDVLGIVLLIGIFMMFWILVIDLIYKLLDPRITYA